jgi:hypothetical protein
MPAGVKLVAMKDGGVLRPWGEAAWNEFERIPQKPKLVTVEVRQPRNPGHLSKYWSILQKAARTDPEYTEAEDLHEWVKVRLGMIKEFKDWDGRILIRTKSISVESMGQIHFANFYDRALWLLSERLGVNPEALLESEAA